MSDREISTVNEQLTGFLDAMYDAGVNIEMISTSEIKITLLIPRKDIDEAMIAVHDKFKIASVNMRKD